MGEEPETLLGEIPVVARLSQGSEKLRLFLTQKRIIVAYVGKRGAGSVTPGALLGELGRGVEELFKGGSEAVRRKRIEELTPRKILAAHKDNFALGYDEVVSVDIFETPASTRITLLSRDDKLELSTRLKADVVTGLLAPNLSGKLNRHKVDS